MPSLSAIGLAHGMIRAVAAIQPEAHRMINRVALLFASVAAVVALVVGLALARLAPPAHPDPAAAVATMPTVPAGPRIQVDLVYVAPGQTTPSIAQPIAPSTGPGTSLVPAPERDHHGYEPQGYDD